jgi:hypothetical protein
VVFVIRMYTAIREDIMSRQTDQRHDRRAHVPW